MRFAILISATLLIGCVESGHDFAPASVSSIQPGATIEEVIAVMGRPNSTVTGQLGGKIMVWTHVTANGLTGATTGKSVSMLFDPQGKFVRVISETETETH